jgi:hypothetical protein
MNILRCVCDLIEDDESTVKQQAFKTLADLLDLHTPEEIVTAKEIMHAVQSQVNERMIASFE